MCGVCVPLKEGCYSKDLIYGGWRCYEFHAYMSLAGISTLRMNLIQLDSFLRHNHFINFKSQPLESDLGAKTNIASLFAGGSTVHVQLREALTL